jgi:hypothetical protein
MSDPRNQGKTAFRGALTTTGTTLLPLTFSFETTDEADMVADAAEF